MKRVSRKTSRRGSVALMAVIFIILIAITAFSILDYSYFSFRSSQRKLRMAQLNLAANNDMEYLFYKWRMSFNTPKGITIEQRLAQGTHVLVDSSVDATPLSLANEPSLTSFIFDYSDQNVSPALPNLNYTRSLIDTGTPARGSVTDSSTGLTRTGNVRYWTVRTRAWVNDPVLGTLEVRLGRHFTYEEVTSCSGAVYYQGDMEFGTSGVMDIYGDVQSNASIYMGTQTGGTLNVHDNIYYVNNFNGTKDLTGTQYSIIPSKSILYSAATFSNESSQVHSLGAPDNFLGLGSTDSTSTVVNGVNYGDQVSAIAATYPQAYPDGANDVYRALIAPPPTDSGGNLIPEDSTVASSRMYNKAGIRITVASDGSISVVDPSTGSDPSGGAIAASITAVRSPVFDARENKNVMMTTIDMSKLTSAIDTAQLSGGTGWTFNGILYINDTSDQTSSLNGIRIINGEKTPNYAYDPSQTSLPPTGFTLASNNGVYVQGDFNTTNGYNTSSSSSQTVNNTAIMADAVTVLSSSWDDSKSTGSLDPNAPVYRGATSNVTINSAVLTGNTASEVTKDSGGNVTGYAMDGATTRPQGSQPIQSGGVQNLVRYLEDWYYGQYNTTAINGSLAQLFNSKYFNSHYYGTGVANNVYNPPVNRSLTFNKNLAANPPNGMPTSHEYFYRGEMFQW